MNAMQQHLLNGLNIVQWQQRGSQPLEVAAETRKNKDLPDWDSLQKQVATCTRCPLHKSRLNPVFGSGSPNADLVIVGEAPGASEDRQGLPFVGRSGQLLTKMLAAIGYQRDNVFICNVLKCRPPNNRDPSAEEVAACTTYLEMQLAHMKPRCLLAVGRVAAHYLLGIEKPLRQLRGTEWRFGQQQVPLFITYHPAYLLRNPRDKQKAYIDLCQVAEFLAG